MTVEELREELKAMPPTAMVEVVIRQNVRYDGMTEDLYEFRTAAIDGMVYSHGVVNIQLDENRTR